MDIKLDDLFGDQEIDYTCPSCEKEFGIKFTEIQHDNSEVTCPHCSVKIEFKHDDTTKKTIKDSEKALKDFNKTFNDLGKTFNKKIKF